MEKDSSKKVTVASIFLALVCVAILGFIIYYKVNNKNEEIPKKEDIVEKEPEKEEKKEEEEPVAEKDDDLAQTLYSVIGTNPELRYTELVTYDTLSESIRDSIVMSNLSSTCEDSVTYAKDLFLAKYKEIFNHDKESEEGLCSLNNSNYECNTYCSEFGVKVFNTFKTYEMSGDSITIYEEAGHLDYADDGKVYLKENAIDSTAIASFEKYEDLINSEVQYKLPTYKHIFTKDENGTYHWVSSESVKQ